MHKIYKRHNYTKFEIFLKQIDSSNIIDTDEFEEDSDKNYNIFFEKFNFCFYEAFPKVQAKQKNKKDLISP